METIGPRKAPCPRCGKLGNRKAIHHRRVRTIASKQVVFRDVTYGDYRARCHCCTTFRTTPQGVEPRALDDNKVREAMLDRLLEDGMSVDRVIASMGRDFLLNLTDGFVYDCLDWQVRAARPGGSPPLGPFSEVQGAAERHGDSLRNRTSSSSILCTRYLATKT